MNQCPNLWQVQVNGWESDLEHLSRHFSLTQFRVSKDERNGGFVYESDLFADCQTSEEVLKLANDELSVLSGVLKMVRDSPESLRTGAVYKRNAAGGRDVFVHVQETSQIRVEPGEVTVTVTDADGNVITRPAPPPRTVTIALKKCGWGSAQDHKRFKHSANSITVAGDSARHGKEVEQPPKHPMSVDEAAAYLNYVLQSWLSSKGG